MTNILARLQVELSDAADGIPTGVYPPHKDYPVYRLVIKPKVDLPVLKRIGESENRDNLETIIAHELGHFIALIFADPSHDKNMLRLSRLTDDSTLVLPAEKKAWQLAGEIKPKLNTKIRDFALGGYESNGANGGGVD